jgi:hypothetical protein
MPEFEMGIEICIDRECIRLRSINLQLRRVLPERPHGKTRDLSTVVVMSSASS